MLQMTNLRKAIPNPPGSNARTAGDPGGTPGGEVQGHVGAPRDPDQVDLLVAETREDVGEPVRLVVGALQGPGLDRVPRFTDRVDGVHGVPRRQFGGVEVPGQRRAHRAGQQDYRRTGAAAPDAGRAEPRLHVQFLRRHRPLPPDRLVGGEVPLLRLLVHELPDHHTPRLFF